MRLETEGVREEEGLTYRLSEGRKEGRRKKEEREGSGRETVQANGSERDADIKTEAQTKLLRGFLISHFQPHVRMRKWFHLSMREILLMTCQRSRCEAWESKR